MLFVFTLFLNVSQASPVEDSEKVIDVNESHQSGLSQRAHMVCNGMHMCSI